MIGVGLPALVSFGATLKLTRYLGAGVNVGLIPTMKISFYGDATLSYQEYDAYARVYPFGGGLFLGAGIGYATVKGTYTENFDLSGYQSPVPGVSLPADALYRSEGSVKTMVVTPQLGVFHSFDSGFSLGFDIGAQVPVAPSQIAFSSSVEANLDPRIPASLRQQLYDEYVGPANHRVEQTLEKVGRSIIPTFNIRIGWII